MKKKLLAILLSGVCVLSVAACGAAGSETAGQTEEAAAEETATAQVDSKETEAAQEADSQGAESAEAEVSEGEEAEASETESKPEDSPVIWCMDEEGIKNEELGVMLRRDNGILEKLSLGVGMQAIVENDTYYPNIGCDYYDGDLDDYIAENTDFEKGMLGNECAFAYQSYEQFGLDAVKFAFVGNGMVLTMDVVISFDSESEEDINADDCLTAINLQPCKDFSQDCLAYTTEEGLYSPALGIAITCEEGKNEVNGQYARLSPDNKDDYSRWFALSSNRWGGSAQEIVDSYVGKNTDDNTEELEGTVETTIAGYQYLGRGVIWRSPWADMENREEWMFVSDDVKWSIEFWCTEEEGHETYLSLLEPLQ